MPINNPDTFWGHVDRTGGPDACWNWTGCRTHDGYGKVKWHGRVVMSHQIAYRLEKGAIPEGSQILHKCDNPACCNPDHLMTGTFIENMRDMVAKGRQDKHFVPRKLDLCKAQEIRRLSIKRTESHAKIAKRFGVSSATVRGIIYGRSWKE